MGLFGCGVWRGARISVDWNEGFFCSGSGSFSDFHFHPFPLLFPKIPPILNMSSFRNISLLTLCNCPRDEGAGAKNKVLWVESFVGEGLYWGCLLRKITI